MAPQPPDVELTALRHEVARLHGENARLREQVVALGGDPTDPTDPTGRGEGEGAPRATQVDLEGLMSVLSNHLYSTPMVAVRELVQNAHDSIVRRRRAEPGFTGGRIRVEAGDGVLVVSDDGEGMTRAEIHDALGVVGRGVTGATRRLTGARDLIGQFGVGFLSAFVLGDDVQVVTASAGDPERCHRYRSVDGLSYDVEPADPGELGDPVGTRVTVRLGERGRELQDPGVLHTVLGRYCALLRVPVELNGERVNTTPPWRAGFDDPGAARTAALEFAGRFEHGDEPLCVLPIEPSDGSDAQGLLWVQSSGSYASSDNRNLSVFVRGMLLDDDARDLLPRWAGMVGGVVESAELVPTASREDLQRTESYEAVGRAVAAQLVDGLAAVARAEPQTWRRIVRRHNEALLGAALVDDRVFELISDVVEIPTSEGDMRPAELVARSNGRVHVSSSVGGGFEEVLCRCLRTPVARGLRFGVAPFLHRWCRVHAVPLVEVGTTDGDRELFRPVDVDPDVAAWLQRGLAGPGEVVVTSRYEPASLPVVLVPDRDAELKARVEAEDTDRRISAAALLLARAHTASIPDAPPVRVHLNLACPSVAALLDARARRSEGADGALAMLRDVKVLLSTAGSELGEGDLVAALDGLGAVMTAMAGGSDSDGGTT